MSLLSNPDGGLLKQLLRFRLWNSAGPPALGGLAAGNEGLVAYDTAAHRPIVLSNDGAVAWQQLLTDLDNTRARVFMYNGAQYVEVTSRRIFIQNSGEPDPTGANTPDGAPTTDDIRLISP